MKYRFEFQGKIDEVELSINDYNRLIKQKGVCADMDWKRKDGNCCVRSRCPFYKIGYCCSEDLYAIAKAMISAITLKQEELEL